MPPFAMDDASKSANDAPRHFQCSTCKRAFTRADHLTRHVRAHTRSKPYVCTTCTKGFSRVDLLKRHAAACADEAPNKRRRKAAVRASRVIEACESCAQSHLRCEHIKPCTRCKGKNIECRIPSTVDVSPKHSTEPVLDDFTHHELFTENETTIFHFEDGQDTPQIMPSNNNVLDSSHQMMTLPFESCPSGISTPRGIMDFSFNWDIDLNDLDMGFLDRYNHQAPFGVDTPSTDAYVSQEITQQPSTGPEHAVSVRHEAFKKSVWRYLPQRNRDFSTAEQPNLAFGDAEMQTSRHQSHLTARRVVQERLCGATRDQLLALVLGTCTPTNVGRIASAFPTVELLDGLLQYFLTSPSLDTKAWFHLPTFSPSQLKPELLANMIAAGAVSTPDIPLRKLGFALHEASRTSMSEAFENDNTSIRDLQHLQTLMLSLEIGMWSGISRKMEIAESFLQPLVTMLRRGGRFRQSIWKDIKPHPNDDEHALGSKWDAWVSQELYLRLVHRAFEHDRQSSMALLKPPLISYSELQLPLPHADALWSASSAQAWKTASMSLSEPPGSAPQHPSATYILDVQPLRCSDSANLVHLYRIWGMIWEYKQMESVTSRLHASQTNSLVLPSRHHELTKYFDDFRVGSNSPTNCSVTLLIELMLMHLNAPLNDIQLFAGIEGHEEASRVYPLLQVWVTTISARQALWHAGQVLCAAKQLPKGQVRNFNAIAIYHAGLIFWGYGCLREAPDHTTKSPNTVHLDSEESIEIRRFIALDHGTPALRGQHPDPPVIAIRDSAGVMDTLIHLLKTNHESIEVEGSCPPLVDNLVQLMHGLRTAVKNNGRKGEVQMSHGPAS